MTTTTLPIQGLDLDGILADRDAQVAAVRAIDAAFCSVPGSWLALSLDEIADRYRNERWDPELAIRFVDRGFWQRVIELGPVWSVLDAKARADWHTEHHALASPPFTRDNVEGALRSLLEARGDMMKRGVAELFRKLSPFEVKVFKNGNGHLRLLHRPDVLRLNKVLNMATGGRLVAGDRRR